MISALRVPRGSFFGFKIKPSLRGCADVVIVELEDWVAPEPKTGARRNAHASQQISSQANYVKMNSLNRGWTFAKFSAHQALLRTA